MQNNKGMWLPLIASVGVGAATYYTMTKNNSNFGQTVQKMAPIVAGMGGGGGNQPPNQNQNQNQNQSLNQNSGQLGPYGMS